MSNFDPIKKNVLHIISSSITILWHNFTFKHSSSVFYYTRKKAHNFKFYYYYYYYHRHHSLSRVSVASVQSISIPLCAIAIISAGRKKNYMLLLHSLPHYSQQHHFPFITSFWLASLPVIKFINSAFIMWRVCCNNDSIEKNKRHWGICRSCFGFPLFCWFEANLDRGWDCQLIKIHDMTDNLIMIIDRKS